LACPLARINEVQVFRSRLAAPPPRRLWRRTRWRTSPTRVYEKLDLANRQGGVSVLNVSAVEIIQELPKLSPAERRAVRRVLTELAAKEEDVQLCNQVATEAAMMFDRMEDEDARRQQG
jgi:hypothetical protein